MFLLFSYLVFVVLPIKVNQGLSHPKEDDIQVEIYFVLVASMIDSSRYFIN